MNAEGRWLGENCTWWHFRGPSAVLVLPPLGYDYYSAYPTLRALATRLAQANFTVVRLDYDGTGDSSHEVEGQEVVAAWRATLAKAVGALRESGASEITVVCPQASALLVSGLADVDGFVLWEPVVAGKRWTRQLRLLGLTAPDGELVFAGMRISADLLAELATCNADRLPAARVLLLGTPSAEMGSLDARLRDAGCAVTTREDAGKQAMFGVQAEEASVAESAIGLILEWLGPAQDGSIAVSLPVEATLAWRGSTVRERHVTVAGMNGIETTGRGPMVVFLNSGSEPHVGPGRAWVEYARELGLAGYSALRIDWPGWGETAADRLGRSYDRACVAHTVRLVHALRQQSRVPIVLAGLCAGAWVAIQSAIAEHVDGVIAINPQLYWDYGQPVEARLADTRARRVNERRKERLGRELGLWSLLDRLGSRPAAARWLAALRRRGTRTLLLFAEADDGLVYLRDRLGRRLSREVATGTLTLTELPDLDHQMFQVWRRGAVVDAFKNYLASYSEPRMEACELSVPGARAR